MKKNLFGVLVLISLLCVLPLAHAAKNEGKVAGVEKARVVGKAPAHAARQEVLKKVSMRLAGREKPSVKEVLQEKKKTQTARREKAVEKNKKAAEKKAALKLGLKTRTWDFLSSQAHRSQ